MIASEQLKRVTKDNPCPHCGKPDWCYSLGELTVCKRGFDPATGWIKTSKTDKDGDYFCAPERPDSSFTRNSYSPRPSSPQPPTIELARLPQQPKPLKSVTKGDQVTTVYPYGSEQQVKRIERFEGDRRVDKVVIPYHQQDSQMVKGKGDLPWPAYRIDEAIRHGKGKWVLAVEGEKCVEAARENQIVAITWQGGSWTHEDIQIELLQLKRSGVKGLLYSPDHDEAGANKAEKVIKAAQQIDFPTATVDPVELWSEIPEKGDIADWIKGVELTPDERAKQLLKIAKLNCSQPQTVTSNQLPRQGSNLKILMELDRARQVIGNRLRFNERTREIEADGERFDLDYPRLELAIRFNLELNLKERDTEGVIWTIAKENAYEPVRDYFDKCAQNHSDTSILDNLAERLFGTSESIHQTMMRKTLIAAVARTYNPGSKCDTATILYSPEQGLGKSTAWKTLFGEDYFCDDMGDISSKDEVAKLHRVLACEWGELETITNKKDVSKVKQFLSTSVDLIREPYGRKVQPNPRRSIIVGSTNTDDFLRDSSGNRRFWVIEVLRDVNINWLKEHRDQIWAAAVHLYQQREKWWLNKSEQEQSNEMNKDFMVELPLEEEILDLVASLDEVTTGWLMKHLSVDTTRINDQRTISIIIKRVLEQNGWKKARLNQDGKRPSGYKRRSTDQESDRDQVGDQVGDQSGDQVKTPVNREFQQADRDDHLKITQIKKNKIPDVQPSPEPIADQIKKDLREALMFNARVSQKEFFSRYPDKQEEVEALLQQIEKAGRIYRKAGYIRSLSPCRFKKGDQVVVTEGDRKGIWGTVQQHNGFNEQGIHSYVVDLDKGSWKEPGIYYENQLRKA